MKLTNAVLTVCVLLALGAGRAGAQSTRSQQPGAAYPGQTAPAPGTEYPSTQQPGTAYPSTQQPQTAHPGSGEAAATSTTTQGATIPAGTQISIRTNEAIKATSQDVGRQYSAEIAQPVNDQSGSVIIPQGSQAMLSIANVSSGTMGVGSNQVTLALQSIVANGRTYNVQTNQVQQQGNRGIGENKRTAEMTGGGAVLGTLLGALAGGGKGAAIGAVVGGAGGATAQVLTRGKEVSVPAESVLNFRLDEPMTLQ